MEVLLRSLGHHVKCVECARWFVADQRAVDGARGERVEEDGAEEAPAPLSPPLEELGREEVEAPPHGPGRRCPECEGEFEPEMSHCPFCGAAADGSRSLAGFDTTREGWRDEQVEESVRKKKLERMAGLGLMIMWSIGAVLLLVTVAVTGSVPAVTFFLASAGSAYIFLRVYREESRIVDAAVGCLAAWLVANVVW